MTWLVLVLSYLLGSIPTAYIASRLLKGKDVRQMGDTNMGAANAYHELGAKVGIVVAGIAAVLGHNFPVFLGFRGGRGVSTSIGVLLVTVTRPMLVMAVPCVVTLVLTRNVTRAMAVLFIPLSGLSFWSGLSGMLISFSILMPVIVGVTHYFRARMPARLNP
jgi:glycerol-3-phosphate acyltransferase PlsY